MAEERFKEIFQEPSELLDKLLDESLSLPDRHLEIEGRLGICGSPFDSNIGENDFHEILKLLDSCNEWDLHHGIPKQFIHTKEYCNNKGLRLTVDPNTNKRISCIEKKKIKTFEYSIENLSRDIRLSFSYEIPKNIDAFPKKLSNYFCREKIRHRYSYNNEFYFDLTQVDEEEGTGVKVRTYQYEIEIINIHSLINKQNESTISAVLHIIYKLLDANLYCNKQIIQTKDNKLNLEEIDIQPI